jgi:hypothetical protein
VAVTLGKEGHNARTGRHWIVIALEYPGTSCTMSYVRRSGRVIAKCHFPRKILLRSGGVSPSSMDDDASGASISVKVGVPQIGGHRQLQWTMRWGAAHDWGTIVKPPTTGCAGIIARSQRGKQPYMNVAGELKMRLESKRSWQIQNSNCIGMDIQHSNSYLSD